MSGTCRVSLLGTFTVEVDGRPIAASEWPARRAADLVKLLALSPRHRLHREQVADALWPDLGPEAAPANCRKAIHFARRALGDEGIGVESGVIVLWPDGRLEIDIDRFESEAALALESADPDEAARVVGAYPGELIPDDPYVTWAIERRAQIKRTYLSLLRLAGRWHDVLELDPLDEVAHREVIRTLWKAGDRQEAIRRFDLFRRRLSDELGIGPHRDTVALYDEILAEEGTEPATPEERARAHIAAGLVALNRMDAREAEREAILAREVARGSGLPVELGEASGLLGMAAHARGRWKSYFRDEFERTLRDVPQFVRYVFEANLCLAEFSLHGTETPDDVTAFARELLDVAAPHRSTPATALALLLLGEAELHAGDLEAAERDLSRAAELCGEGDALSGRALALQRIAQNALLQGERERAAGLLVDAGAIALRSTLMPHLIIRVHGTLVRAAQDPATAVEVIAATESEREGVDACDPCSMDYRVAATIALARAGDINQATIALERAERIAGMWQGGPWQASVWEARGELRLAEGRMQQAIAHFTEAAELFEQVGHPLAATRCSHRAELVAR